MKISIKDAVAMVSKMYLGETCAICGKVFETEEELNGAVWNKAGEYGWAHIECWKKNRNIVTVTIENVLFIVQKTFRKMWRAK